MRRQGVSPGRWPVSRTSRYRAIGGMAFDFNQPGQWAFFDAGSRHEVRNTGTGRLEVIEVEVRRS